MENWSLSKIVLTVAALAIVAGGSFLFASSRNEPTILDNPPDVIRNINPEKDPFKGAGPDQPGGIAVVPTEIIAEDAIVGAKLPGIVISNNSQTKQALGLSFVPVTRSLYTGGPVIPNRPEDIRKGQSILRLDQDRIILKPGESRTVSATIVGGDNKKMVVGALTVSFLGSGNIIRLPDAKDVSPRIKNTIGISSMIYLTFDDPDSEQISLEGLNAQAERVQGKPVRISFAAAVKSENDFLATPTGVIVVRDASGTPVANLPFVGDQNVLPRQRREINTSGSVRLKPGNYEVEARVVSGDSGQSLVKPLEIAGDGAPVEVKASAIITTDQVRTKPDSSFPVQVQVANNGNKDFDPQGTLSVYPLAGDKPIDEQNINLDPVAPGDAATQNITIDAPETQGEYTIVARIFDGDSFLTESSANMVVTKTDVLEKDTSVEVRDWLSDNPLRAVALGVILFGFLAAVGVGIAAMVARRRQG